MPDLAPAVEHELRLGERADVPAADGDAPLGWPVDAAQQVEQSRLAAAGLAHQREELARWHVEIQAVQGDHGLAACVDFAESAAGNGRGSGCRRRHDGRIPERYRPSLKLLLPFSRVVRQRALIRALVRRELSARYRGGALGFLWSLVNPLLLLLVYATVFRFVFAPRADVRPYALFLFGGVLVWGFVSAALLDAVETFRVNGPLLRKTTVAPEVFPAAAVGARLTHLLLALPVLAAAIGVAAARGRIQPAAAFLEFPLVLALLVVTVLGATFLCSALAVHFADVRDVVGNLLTLSFFLTPVLYPVEAVPERWRGFSARQPLGPVFLGPARHPLLLSAGPRRGLGLDGGLGGAVARRGRRRVRASPRLPGGGGMSARAASVSVRGVSKVFRRYARRPHGTLKSAILSRQPSASDGGVAALSEVSFEVGAGETLGVIGANGSGKSTLLKLLAGILRPTRGTVSVQGRLAALLELGAGFHPEISGRENVEITGLLLGLTRAQIAARFDEIVRFAGVEEFLDAPVKTYSSGMAVRLGFAIAAASDPDVFLVDEVLAVGDEAFAHRALERFSEFERAGKTLVFVSHDLSLVTDRCRRAIWLDGGRVAADGPAAETVALYRDHVAEAEGSRRLREAGASGRVGSGVAAIEGVRVLDREGRAAGRLRRGEPATLEMTVHAKEPLSDFVFGFQIATVVGNRRVRLEHVSRRPHAGVLLGGVARVALAIPSLDLAPGVYSVDAAVHARGGAPYDYRQDALRFEVTAESSSAGTWSPPRRWSVTGEVRWKA